MKQRILNVVEDAMNDTVFEVNTEKVRNKLINTIVQYLNESRCELAVSIICDERNNTAEIIDKNRLCVTIQFHAPDGIETSCLLTLKPLYPKSRQLTLIPLYTCIDRFWIE